MEIAYEVSFMKRKNLVAGLLAILLVCTSLMLPCGNALAGSQALLTPKQRVRLAALAAEQNPYEALFPQAAFDYYLAALKKRDAAAFLGCTQYAPKVREAFAQCEANYIALYQSDTEAFAMEQARLGAASDLVAKYMGKVAKAVKSEEPQTFINFYCKSPYPKAIKEYAVVLRSADEVDLPTLCPVFATLGCTQAAQFVVLDKKYNKVVQVALTAVVYDGSWYVVDATAEAAVDAMLDDPATNWQVRSLIASPGYASPEQATILVEQILGPEHVAFLDSIGVDIVGGTLQVTSVEQFKAIGDAYNAQITARYGCEPVDAYSMLFYYNFDVLSEELKRELVAEGVVGKEYEDHYTKEQLFVSEGSYIDAISDVFKDTRAYSNDQITLLIGLKEILSLDSAYQLLMSYTMTNDAQERVRLANECANYLDGKEQGGFPFPIEDVSPSFYRIDVPNRTFVWGFAILETGNNYISLYGDEDYMTQEAAAICASAIDNSSFARERVSAYSKYVEENFPRVD